MTVPYAQYCKKCKAEVPLGETCAYCGKKLPKTGRMLSFGVTHLPVRDWFCWNDLLRVALPVLLCITLGTLLAEGILGGMGSVRFLISQGFLLTMLLLTGVMLLLCWGLLLLQGGERIHYVFDKDGIHAWTYLQNPSKMQLRARFLSQDAVDRLAQDEHALPGLTLVKQQHLSWQNVDKVAFWRENCVIMLYHPSMWQAMFVNCSVDELPLAEEMIRAKLKQRKQVKIKG